MKRLTFLVLAIAAGCAAWACSASEDDAGEGESAFTGDNVVKVATCEAGDATKDLPTTIAPFSAKEKYRFENVVPELKNVVTKLELNLKVVDADGKRKIESLSGTATVGPAPAQLKFAPNAGDLAAGEGRSFERHTLLAKNLDDSSTVSAGPIVLKVNELALHWESNGKGWVMVGVYQRTDNGEIGEAKLVGTAPNCTFDVKAWNLLQDVTCEDELYGGGEAKRPECHRTPFAASTNNADAGNDAAAEAAAATDPQPDAAVANPPDAAVPDAGTTNDGGTTPKKDAGSTTTKTPRSPYDAGPDFPEDDRFGAADGTSSAAPNSKSPTKVAPKVRSDSDCSVAYGPQPANVAGLGLAAALALAAARRRRKR